MTMGLKFELSVQLLSKQRRIFHAIFNGTDNLKMQLINLLTPLLFCLLAFAKDSPSELVIETTYTPDKCDVKAAKGDSIQVHYVWTYILSEDWLAQPSYRPENFSRMGTSLILGSYHSSSCGIVVLIRRKQP